MCIKWADYNSAELGPISLQGCLLVLLESGEVRKEKFEK